MMKRIQLVSQFNWELCLEHHDYRNYNCCNQSETTAKGWREGNISCDFYNKPWHTRAIVGNYMANLQTRWVADLETKQGEECKLRRRCEFLDLWHLPLAKGSCSISTSCCIKLNLKLLFQPVLLLKKISSKRPHYFKELYTMDHWFKCINHMTSQSTCFDTPQQNNIAERKNWHLLEVARAIMFTMGVPK